jgi:23S rRNA G2445 N2-methylase RlmL
MKEVTHVQDFKGVTITDLAKELIEHRAVRVHFQYRPSRYNVEDVAKRVKEAVQYKFKKTIHQVKFFQLNEPDREFDSWVFTYSAPSNNLEAKHYLSDTFM